MPATLELAPAPHSVPMARRWCRAVVGPMAGPERTELVGLLVSELVSNVVLHAGTPCHLQVSATAEDVRIEVHDGCDRLPVVPATSDPLECSGRGLLLVRALSTSFGIDASPEGGKRVWFEVPRGPTDDGTAPPARSPAWTLQPRPAGR